jgi:hypothetical protein
MRVDLDDGPARRRVQIGVARLAAVEAAGAASKATMKELLHIKEPRSEKTEGIVWEEV